MIDEIENLEELASHVRQLIDTCENYSEDQSKNRQTVLEYVDGEMNDLPAEEGRSQVVSSDVRAVIQKVKPSIMRSLLGNDRIVEYEPTGPEDEETAKQATHYVNQAVLPECGAEDAIYDAVDDALKIKTGILKWSAYKTAKVVHREYTDQPAEALLGLEGEPGVEILDLVQVPETDLDVLALDPQAKRCSFTIKRLEEKVEPTLEAVERGSFLIAPGSKSIEDAPIVGERQLPTRSDLVQRGYDKDTIASLSCYDRADDDENDRQEREGDDWSEQTIQTRKAMEQVLIYEMYVYLDLDEDGIAELYKVVLGETKGDESKTEVLEIEPFDEAPYAEVKCEREAHSFEGHSIAEDMIEIQRVKTALLRETLDNLYGQNKPQPVFNPSNFTAEGLESLSNPEFGKPITTTNSVQDARTAVHYSSIPFVADKSFSMLEYMDQEAKDRTGVTDQSGGVDAEALTNMSATGATLLSESGIAQAVMMIRSLSKGGIKKAFKGLLKLVIEHSDRAKTLKLRGEWVQYDPRTWNTELDCTVNIGLGAGSKERDLVVLQMILGLQREIIGAMGPNNPFVKPKQLYNSLEQIVETAGLPNAEPYFTEPQEGEVEQMMAGAQQDPKAEAEKEKAQIQARLKEQETQGRIAIERAQMQADVRVKEVETRFKAMIEELKANTKADSDRLKVEVDLLKHRENLAFEYEKEGLKALQAEQQRFDQNSLINAG